MDMFLVEETGLAYEGVYQGKILVLRKKEVGLV